MMVIGIKTAKYSCVFSNRNNAKLKQKEELIWQ
jgi:hypothetical protein